MTGIKDAIGKVLKEIWDIETELRGAARSGVVLRREDAKKHLTEARRHLDQLRGLIRSSAKQSDTETGNPADRPAIGNRSTSRSEHHGT
jgi:hypothetical protein